MSTNCVKIEVPWVEDGSEEINPDAKNWRANLDAAHAKPKRSRLDKWIDWQNQMAETKHAALDAEFMAIVRGK